MAVIVAVVPAGTVVPAPAEKLAAMRVPPEGTGSGTDVACVGTDMIDVRGTPGVGVGNGSRWVTAPPPQPTATDNAATGIRPTT
jgi:hypothetical protein